MHLELHYCPTAKDAARLQYGGLPRYDIEPAACGACHARVGEVNGQGETVSWRALTVVVWDNGVDVLCARCTKPVQKLVG